MADIRAFRAFRYDLGRVGNLSDVIAPPYDVIDPALQQALYDKSPYNAVRVELNKEEPSDNDTENRYARAARFLRDWQRDDVLVQDSARGLYVLHQDFEVEGRRYTRRGFLSRVRLEPFGAGRIYAHEETMAGPKADRLKLFHATGMNLSPIFGLYPDPGDEVMNPLDALVSRTLPIQATDHLGVVSKLWPVTDQHIVSAVTGLLGPKPVFIADGHHRYETSLRYLEERRAAAPTLPSPKLGEGKGGGDGIVKLWEVSSGKEMASWPAHSGDVTALAFAPRAPQLATSGGDAVIKVWQISDTPRSQAEL
ncbi:MAG: DUF1015 family protein, partial [Gemmataceae bacterium]